MILKKIRQNALSSALILGLSLPNMSYAKEANPSPQNPNLDDIKAYCIDFNWGHGRRAGFAAPGMWKDANPKAHVAWYKAVNANVIQTFAVSCNGYAWYKSKVIPSQPGLKHDFLTEVVKLGHAEGMKVMGYFCIAANSRWGKENPELSYGTPSGYHIPYTDEYLEYLTLAITDAIKTTGIDGFMIDWVWMPKRSGGGKGKGPKKWLEAEKKLYQQLMKEPFPEDGKLTPEQNLAYGQKAIDRCWEAIHKAAKSADPDCIIWLTTNKAHSPLVINSKMYKEVDWLMGEAGKLSEIEKLRPHVGEHTQLLTCLSDFGGGDASKDVPEALKAGVGLYGYAKPDRDSKGGLINLDRIFPKQLTQLAGNSKRIAALARAYGGKSLDSIWKDGQFTEPETPLPFKLELRRRSSRHGADYGRIDVEGDSATVKITRSPFQKGRAMLTRSGDSWPSSITISIAKDTGKKPKPYPPEFRVSNGELGVSIVQGKTLAVIAGKMKDELNLSKPWQTNFLNQGKPKSPVDVGKVNTSINEDAVEITLPKAMTETNPQSICFEWGIDGKVM